MLKFKRADYFGKKSWLFWCKDIRAMSFQRIPSITFLILDRIKYYGAPYLGVEFYKELGLKHPND